MSDFMDGVTEDLDTVFLDLDVFGERHVVQGEEITILYDNEELERIKEKKEKKKENRFEDDVHKADVLFYARESDLGSELSVNSLLSIDGKRYFIYQTRLVAGLWKIILGRKQL